MRRVSEDIRYYHKEPPFMVFNLQTMLFMKYTIAPHRYSRAAISSKTWKCQRFFVFF
jgi:hypothetical protein